MCPSITHLLSPGRMLSGHRDHGQEWQHEPMKMTPHSESLWCSSLGLRKCFPFSLIHVLGLLPCSSNVCHCPSDDLKIFLMTSPSNITPTPERKRNPAWEKALPEAPGRACQYSVVPGQAGEFSMIVGTDSERRWLKFLLCQRVPLSLRSLVSRTELK